MHGSRAHRPARTLPALAVALLVCLVAAPSGADAGCSALAHSPGMDRLGHHFSPLIVDGTPATGDAPVIPVDSRLPKPCSGPSCSDNSAPPVAPPVGIVGYVEGWALWSLSGAVPPASSHPLAGDPCGGRPLRSPSGMFRPPRG